MEATDIKENWITVKETIRREYNISDISYQTWISPLEFYNVIDDVVNIIIPSDQSHALNYISTKYKSFFQVISHGINILINYFIINFVNFLSCIFKSVAHIGTMNTFV